MFEKDEDYRKAKSECKVRITKAIKVWSGREEAIRDASFKDGVEFGYNKANEEMKDIIKKLLHKLIMASASYKTDLTEEEIAEIRKFIPKEVEGA